MANIGKGFWKNMLPKKVTDKIRKVFLFKPDDSHNLWQVPPANTPEVGRFNKSYRYPTPNSQTQANVPDKADPDTTYDIGYFKRDTTRRLPNEDVAWVSPALKGELADGKQEAEALLERKAGPDIPQASRGNKNPAVLKYDPSGLRSTMSATESAMQESLETFRPDHMVRPSWMDEDVDILQEAKSKGLPPPPGRPYRW